MKDTSGEACILCGDVKWGYKDSKGIKICWNCSHEWGEKTKHMALFNLVEVPVQMDRQDNFRKEISDTDAEIKNVIEIIRGKLMLFIVDPKKTAHDKIMDAGFKTFLSKDGLKIYKEREHYGSY